MTTALCLLVWNERRGCEHDLPRIDLDRFDEVFAIDGGSTDGTREVLLDYGIEVRRQPRPSLNAAYWHAVETCQSDSLIVFFPKGTLDPSVTYRIQEKLAEGYDLVQPTRVAQGGRNEEDVKLFRPRKWGVKALALIAAALWRQEGPFISDVLHGVKGFSRTAFLRMNPSPTGVSIDLEMAIRSYKRRLRRCEFPVAEWSQPWTKTHFKILPTGLRLAQCLWRELRTTPPECSVSSAAPERLEPEP